MKYCELCSCYLFKTFEFQRETTKLEFFVGKQTEGKLSSVNIELKSKFQSWWTVELVKYSVLAWCNKIKAYSWNILLLASSYFTSPKTDKFEWQRHSHSWKPHHTKSIWINHKIHIFLRQEILKKYTKQNPSKEIKFTKSKQ